MVVEVAGLIPNLSNMAEREDKKKTFSLAINKALVWLN
jgi:hypothetical protein